MTADADQLRAELVNTLARGSSLADVAWRKAFEMVPRHTFVPGFYLRSATEPTGADGLPVWEPVTETLDRDRWLTAAYSNDTLITQLDEIEEDWSAPQVRHGGLFTSSSTLPSLVATMWHDSDIHDGHRVLEIGTGTGYSTALACERLGSAFVTSVEVDDARLRQAFEALRACGYAPRLAVADGVYGYWPSAPYDRIVAACSMRHVPAPLIGQTAPGGKILLTLSGWMHANARVLLTVNADGQAEGTFLPGTISFMMARRHDSPRFGNPNQWATLVEGIEARPVHHTPERISGATRESFFTQFLAQCAIPNAQRINLGGTLHVVDTVSGSVALVEPNEHGGHQVRQAGPVALWNRTEGVLDAYDAAGKPDQTEFRLLVTPEGQYVEHPGMPTLTLAP